MTKQDAEKAIAPYIKPIFGFALRRCKNVHDAQDLSQEIALRAYRALLGQEEIGAMNKLIWTIAHHALSNYYRDTARRSAAGISLDEVEESIAAPDAGRQEAEGREETDRLRREIAYLSKMQREIVIAYYFENRKQAQIAQRLGIPTGTVKWHLFEARKELKRGMKMTREAGELTFNPIRFNHYHIAGSGGKKDGGEFFRSALTQNICYCVRSEEKTINEIAQALGVSPVYIEGEAQYLEEYGFLKESRGKYIANFIISEPTRELLEMKENMHRQAAQLIAGPLYDGLRASGLLAHPDIVCGQDENFILWSLVPYIAAKSGEALRERRISFDEVATLRPDGAKNIYQATVLHDGAAFAQDSADAGDWSGPLWNGNGRHILWRIDNEWTRHEEECQGFLYREDAMRALDLYERQEEGRLDREDFAWLAQRGYIRMEEGRAVWQIVLLKSAQIQRRLLAVGDAVKEGCWAEIERIKAPYVRAALEPVPVHLKKVKEHELQYLFYSDANFLYWCIRVLLDEGKLKPPREEQKKPLLTMILRDGGRGELHEREVK